MKNVEDKEKVKLHFLLYMCIWEGILTQTAVFMGNTCVFMCCMYYIQHNIYTHRIYGDI